MLVTQALREIDVDQTRVVTTDGTRITGFVRLGAVRYQPDRFANQTLADIGAADFVIVSNQDNLNTVVTRMNRRNRTSAIVVRPGRGVPRADDIEGIIAREEIANAVVRNHYG